MSPPPRNQVAVAVGPVVEPSKHPELRQQLSPGELGYCLGLQRTGEHMTARVLAKRAVLDVLGLPAGPGWPGVEIHRVPGAPPTVRLDGEVARWCATHGLPTPGVSLSHGAGYAAALAWLPGDR